MPSERILDSDHISRYCGGVQVKEDGTVSGTAFRLRKQREAWEEYLSVNWLEFLERNSRDKQITEVQNVIAGKLNARAKAVLAVLNVGRMRAHVFNNSDDHRDLRAVHAPEHDDSSHSGVYGLQPEDDEVADLIAQVVQETYPARKYK